MRSFLLLFFKYLDLVSILRMLLLSNIVVVAKLMFKTVYTFFILF